MSAETEIATRIEMIQQELEEIKKLVSGGDRGMTGLPGLWKGADFSDEEIEEAKRSLSSGIEKYESG